MTTRSLRLAGLFSLLLGSGITLGVRTFVNDTWQPIGAVAKVQAPLGVNNIQTRTATVNTFLNGIFVHGSVLCSNGAVCGISPSAMLSTANSNTWRADQIFQGTPSGTTAVEIRPSGDNAHVGLFLRARGGGQSVPLVEGFDAGNDTEVMEMRPNGRWNAQAQNAASPATIWFGINCGSGASCAGLGEGGGNPTDYYVGRTDNGGPFEIIQNSNVMTSEKTDGTTEQVAAETFDQNITLAANKVANGVLHGDFSNWDGRGLAGSATTALGQFSWPAGSPTITLAQCDYTVQVAGAGAGTCTLDINDVGQATTCTVSLTCSSVATTHAQTTCSGGNTVTIAAGDTIVFHEGAPAANTTPQGSFHCSY